MLNVTIHRVKSNIHISLLLSACSCLICFLTLCFWSLRKVIFEKQWFFLDNAVGQLYGTMFEITAGGSLKLKAPKHSGDSLGNDAVDLCCYLWIYLCSRWRDEIMFLFSPVTDSKEAGQDNRHIVDDGRSQKLTRDDIETLKEQGLKGQVCTWVKFLGMHVN